MWDTCIIPSCKILWLVLISHLCFDHQWFCFGILQFQKILVVYILFAAFITSTSPLIEFIHFRTYFFDKFLKKHQRASMFLFPLKDRWMGLFAPWYLYPLHSGSIRSILDNELLLERRNDILSNLVSILHVQDTRHILSLDLPK